MSRARILLTLVALALLAAWAAWWLDRSPAIADTDASARSEPAIEASSPVPSRLAAPRTTPAQPVNASARELVAIADPRTASAAPSQPDLRGRLVLIEPDGTEATNGSGSLTWTRWVGVTPSYHQTPVVNGEWAVGGESLRGLRAISFKSVRVGMQEAAVEAPRGLHSPPFDEPFEVRARILPNASLRVLDAATGLDLEDVMLVSRPSDIGRHPGIDFESRIVGSDLRSPIFLEEPLFSRQQFNRRGEKALLVGAQGFAWTLVELDAETEGEQRVALERGADLALTIRGCDPAAHARLRLRKGKEVNGEIYTEVGLCADDCLRFSGLPSAPLQASAIVGSRHSSIDLGTIELQLRAGELTEGTLDLAAAPPLLLADASGVVFVPKAWETSRLLLDLRLLDVPLGGFTATREVGATQVRSALEGFDAFTWSEKRLQVGRYELRASNPSHLATLEVPLGGLAGFEVRVPPPMELLVHIVDEATGLPIEAITLAWLQKRESGEIFAVESSESDASGVVRIRAPACEVELIARDEEYHRYVERVDLSAGSRELTIRLQKACGIILRLTYNGSLVEIPRDLRRQFRSTIQAESIAIATLEPKCRISLREPGTISFRIAELPGYEPVPMQSVTVPPGQFIEHVIELTRRP